MDWYTLAPDEVARRLSVIPDVGLSEHEARERGAAQGLNEIEEGSRRGPWRIACDQFADFMIAILLAAAAISWMIGDLSDTLAILAIVILNAAVRFIQEYRAERAIAALKSLAAPVARVLRDGRNVNVAAVGLAPGDIVLLEAGNAIAADLRLIEAQSLQLDEAPLTGESQPVEKIVQALTQPGLVVGDRRNMAYKGTWVTHGRARGIVVATGMHTELGRIAALLQASETPKTPLQKRLARFGRWLALAVAVLCAIVLAAGVLRGEPVGLSYSSPSVSRSLRFPRPCPRSSPWRWPSARDAWRRTTR